jgi:hypothetical protein
MKKFAETARQDLRLLNHSLILDDIILIKNKRQYIKTRKLSFTILKKIKLQISPPHSCRRSLLDKVKVMSIDIVNPAHIQSYLPRWAVLTTVVRLSKTDLLYQFKFGA